MVTCGREVKRKKTYNVYVVELSRDVLEHNKFVMANLYLRADKPCVYVGSTCLKPQKRYQQHLDGYKSNRYAHEYAIALMPELYEDLQGLPTRKAAEEAEANLAERLREQGYAVWYGV